MITIKRMSDCAFAEVTKAWNRGFEGYFFPIAMTEALLVEDAQGQAVGYAMYNRMASDEGKVSAIVLRHCAAQPGHADADTILRVALAELYGPHELECRRSTFNLWQFGHGCLLFWAMRTVKQQQGSIPFSKSDKISNALPKSGNIV